ncbi:MAG: DUF1330 domain-containing protein, partial [Actinomycetes bacterium]
CETQVIRPAPIRRGVTHMTDETAPAYAMVQIKIKNPAEFNERYSQYVFPILEQFGVQMVAGSPTPTTREGDFDGNWAAILRFPSMSAAQAWYDSADYEPFKQLRINELTDSNSIVFLEGFPVTVPVS